MTIRISGSIIPVAKAKEIASYERLEDKRLPQQSRRELDDFCVSHVIRAINAEHMSFISTTDFLAKVIAELRAAHLALEPLKTAWRGKTNPGYISLLTIPQAHRAAVINLINNGDPAPGHDRGRHQTNPTTAIGGSYREYDLTAQNAGRMTTRNQHGRQGYYYSPHHAAATYQYLLITDDAGRPILRGLPPKIMTVPA
ncbi:hypothetical protein M3I54_01275 [Paraburkholderia sp. CNPSo 3274]|uniref:hypothetical protein n=1 Tax=Paraburkholderia sp. CNPSo 3274 TaxID=2940932 RepID=UPI0020B89EE7|nr:hypothetical protein [Paraburkholderia sp. CNPSo 3274]MCP3705633.1 hypothetical protein [Paraburkholderia sp. CNPSo 3274]